MNVTLRTMGGSISHIAEALPVFSPLTKKIAAFVGIIFAAMISIYAILKLTEKAASTFDEQFDDNAPIVNRKKSTKKLNLKIQDILEKAEIEFKKDIFKNDIIDYIKDQAEGQHNSDDIISKFHIEVGRNMRSFVSLNSTIVEDKAAKFLGNLGIEVNKATYPFEKKNPSNTK